ncbi:MAG TPA: methyltransferase domain-containing protein [Burkholderiaceae bacterium]|nr:methyltransferase domain-containing protein [Burkholderiaceae bacterium]
MAADPDVTRHYSRGDLLARLEAALRDDGVDPRHPTARALAPYDQFHGRGIEATREAAALVQAGSGDHLLDIGSGIGGPARYFAQHFGCRVTGIDLTPEYCDVARHLTRLLNLQDRVSFEVGNALAMPFDDAQFDGAFSMNVSMNIEDKSALYREAHRVLRPGAWLVLSELALGQGGAIDYPTPWASRAGESFLATPADTERGLVSAGFEVLQRRSTAEESKAFAVRSRGFVDRGEKPPHRAVMLMYDELATTAMTNIARALSGGAVVPIEILARRR